MLGEALQIGFMINGVALQVMVSFALLTALGCSAGPAEGTTEEGVSQTDQALRTIGLADAFFSQIGRAHV